MRSTRTVEAALRAFAHEHRAEFDAVLERHEEQTGIAALPPRYRRLAEEVWLALPDGWDSHAVWSVRVEDIASAVDHFYAGSSLLHGPHADDGSDPRDGFVQIWEVVLCSPRLDRLSDAAVRGVIVHEFGHVASALPTKPQWRNDELCENRADNIAKWWGFLSDLEALGVVK